MLDLLGKAALGRLGDHLQDVAVHVEFPAMIEAAQPAFLVAAEEQRGLAVRAELAEHADPPVRVAIGDQILAEKPDPDRRAITLDELLGEQGGRPVPPHQLPHRGIALDPREDLVLLLRQHDGLPSRSPGTSLEQIT